MVHTSDLSTEVIELVALLSQTAAEIKLHTHDISNAHAAAAFAQTSAQAYGGLDAAINLVSISSDEMNSIDGDDVESLMQAKLAPLAQLTRIIANRMSVVMSEGLILNILAMPAPATGRQSAVATVARTALAAMTRAEARRWSVNGIRINAVGPSVMIDARNVPLPGLSNEPEVATLALYLASGAGRSFSGHVFDADGVAC